MSGLKFVLVVGSVREGRMADRMIKLIEAEFEKVMKPKGHSLKIIDPAKLDLSILKKPLHFYQDRSEAPAILHEINDVANEADAFLMLLAEYNRTLPPAITNTLDHLPVSSFGFKASATIGYSMGSRGGSSVCNAALPWLTELGCLPIKQLTTVGNVHKEVKEDGTTDNHHIQSSLGKVFNELEWWATAAKNMRDANGLPK